MLLAQITPFIVRVVEPPTKETTVADVLLGAVGLTGLILVSALLFGLLLGGVLVAMHRWRPSNRLNGQSAEEVSLRLNSLPHG